MVGIVKRREPKPGGVVECTAPCPSMCMARGYKLCWLSRWLTNQEMNTVKAAARGSIPVWASAWVPDIDLQTTCDDQVLTNATIIAVIAIPENPLL